MLVLRATTNRATLSHRLGDMLRGRGEQIWHTGRPDILHQNQIEFSHQLQTIVDNLMYTEICIFISLLSLCGCCAWRQSAYITKCALIILVNIQGEVSQSSS